jgi:L-asparaginase II
MSTANTILDLDDTQTPVYPLSAVKPMQALPQLESGGADHWSTTRR